MYYVLSGSSHGERDWTLMFNWRLIVKRLKRLSSSVHHNYVNVQVSNHHRLSGTSYESGVSSRQSYHSTSSSSVGSLDRLEESGYSSQINVAELFQAGIPDHEVLRAWLSDLRYEEYFQNFIQAGYDMPTITHMTPQDLTAIGISKPGHRKKLKAEIARLNIHDGIPDYKPNDLFDWLRMLGLEQYYNTLGNQGYNNIDYVTDITWEDLEEIGIQKLGHQKKIMLAIDRLKRIMSGTKRLSTMDGARDTQEALDPPMACVRWSGERSSPPPPAPPQYDELPPYLKPRRSSSGDSLSTNSSGAVDSMNQPLESEYANTNSMQAGKPGAVVPIKVKRLMSQSTPNGIVDGNEDASGQKMCKSFHAPADRNSDYSDRENTPTGDDPDQGTRLSMDTAPVAPTVKQKPVAKIIAKSKHSSREGSPDVSNIEKHEAERNNDGYKSPAKSLDGFNYPLASNGSLKRRTSEHIYDTPQPGPPRTVSNYVNYPPVSMHQVPSGVGSPVHVNTQFSYPQQPNSPRGLQHSPGGRAKKAPPPPPKRTASIRTSFEGSKLPESESEACVTTTSSPVASVLTPPPVPHKPHMSTPQAQAFVNCVQSLSERFGKKSEDNTCDNLSSDGEDLPPPPPPVAMDIITPKISNYGLLGKSDIPTSGEYMLQQRLKREGSSSANNGNNSVESAFGVKLRQAKTESNSQLQSQSEESYPGTPPVSSGPSNQSVQDNMVHSAQNYVQLSASEVSNENKTLNVQSGENKQRKDSSGSSGDISSSTTSLDSNTLPFANENVGTIKQRTPAAKPSLVSVLDDGASDQCDMEMADKMDTIKRTPNKLPKPQLQTIQMLQQQQGFDNPAGSTGLQSVEQIRRLSQQGQATQPATQQSYNASVTASYIPGTQVMSSSKGDQPTVPPKPKPAVSPKPQRGAITSGAAPKGTKSGDVLSEIDNMLQGLTDELDAMLEFEIDEAVQQ